MFISWKDEITEEELSEAIRIHEENERLCDDRLLWLAMEAWRKAIKEERIN